MCWKKFTVCCECLLIQVFEVNSSDQRDGKHLLAQLQEATQSHQLPRTALAPSGDSLQNIAHSPRGDLSISLKNLLSYCYVTLHKMIILMCVKGKLCRVSSHFFWNTLYL